jgi:hypothetical protein
MALRRLLLPGAAFAVVGLAAAEGERPAPARADPARALPPLAADDALPPLPERSPRVASYAIEARLDPEARTIDGSMLLEWRNTSGAPLREFPFHLYWNAFRNNLSTHIREGPRRLKRRHASGGEWERRLGFIDVRRVVLLGEPEADLTPTMRFVQPDDGNADDRTVMQVEAPAPIAPGALARFRIEWTARVPYGDVGRAGWVHDYHFIVQWFPKIGVHWNGEWNCHQFHAWSEFFADFGNYDVRLTLPQGFVVGATGALREGPTANPDGTQTLRFVQEDVHDFAWCASRRFLERRGRFEAPGHPPVEIRLLIQPEHAGLAQRYLAATRAALHAYGAWSAPYPYAQITVVDPAWRSASGGMEYPTLITGGSRVFAPLELRSPEGVTIHEAGHQFWYGLVANNEFEEAWLDEGFNTYHTAKTEDLFYGPEGWGRRYFGPREEGRALGGWPVVAPGVWLGRGEDRLEGLREAGENDVMARRSWEYRNRASYGLNSYGKPALTLQTLEGLVGDETMTRILRTYARRHRFGHPTTEDFIRTVNEVTGQDWRWFFEQTFFSSERVDYAVGVRNSRARHLAGFGDGEAGRPPLTPPSESDRDQAPWEAEVELRRLGGARLPVELLVQFEGGATASERWDGKDRWQRFRYPRKVVRAAVDPDAKLALDVDPSNNAWVEERGVARRAAFKWSARFLLWLQHLLELHTVLG